MTKILRFLFGLVHKIVIIGILYLLISTFLIQPFLVERTDMSPNYLAGDVVFIRKYEYGYNRHSFPFSIPLLPTRVFGRVPAAGDVIAYVTTEAMQERGEGRIAIKRVIAVPGDKIYIKNGILCVNDKKNYVQRDGAIKLFEDGTIQNGKNIEGDIYDRFIEEYHIGFKHHIIRKGILPRFHMYMEPITVPEGKFFVIGDKRDTSIDSRVEGYGLVPMEAIMGRVRVVFFKINLPKQALGNYIDWFKNYDHERFLLKVQNH